MANRDVRVDQTAASGDEPESAGGSGGGAGSGSAPSGGGSPSRDEAPDTHGVPSAGADGSPAGSEGPPPSGEPDELGDPKHAPPTVVDDGGVGGEGLVGAGGNGGRGGGGLLSRVADAAGDLVDAAEDLYDDVEEEVDETYDDASKLDHSGEHWGGLAGTPDEAIGAVLDAVDPDHRLEEFNRDAGAAIDHAARGAGDTFRDAGNAVNEVYDDSGVDPVITDAREAGAVVVPDVVEDVYDQSEDLAHQTYGEVEEEIVETYEDMSYFETKGEHWGGLAGTPDHWLDPLVDGAENIAEAPGGWYDKSGIGDFGAGADGGAAGESDVPGVDDFGRGSGSDASDPFATDDGLLLGAEETVELAGEEEAQRVSAGVGDLTADPSPIEVPYDTIELPELTGAPQRTEFDVDDVDGLDQVGRVDDSIEPIDPI